MILSARQIANILVDGTIITRDGETEFLLEAAWLSHSAAFDFITQPCIVCETAGHSDTVVHFTPPIATAAAPARAEGNLVQFISNVLRCGWHKTVQENLSGGGVSAARALGQRGHQ